MSSGGTNLRLSWRLGASLGFLIVLVGLCLGLVELGARIGFVVRGLPRPVRVASLPEMDVKLYGLDRLVADEGAADCLFLGGVGAAEGMDPSGFARSYRTRAGRGIRCYNFAMRGASMQTVAMLADILVRKYAVDLIVLGVAVERPQEEMGQILQEKATQEAWLRLYNGTFTIEGWLIEHSAAYRQFLGIRKRFFYPVPPEPQPERGPEPPREQETHRDEELPRPPQSLHAVEKIIRVLPRGHAVVVEMPLRVQVRRRLSGGEAGYERAIVAIAERAKRSEAAFWRAEDLGSIPDEGWQDDLHLNRLGAGLLSAELGARVGDAVHQGIMPDPLGGRSAPR